MKEYVVNQAKCAVREVSLAQKVVVGGVPMDSIYVEGASPRKT